MRYKWDNKYNTGNAKIDDQHQQIFNAANLLSDAVRNKKEEQILDRAFDLLIQYTNTHFSDEEKFYQQISTPFLKAHIEEHRRLLHDIREMWREKRRGSRDAGTDLDHWMEQRLIPHIIAEDTRTQKSGRK